VIVERKKISDTSKIKLEFFLHGTEGLFASTSYRAIAKLHPSLIHLLAIRQNAEAEEKFHVPFATLNSWPRSLTLNALNAENISAARSRKPFVLKTAAHCMCALISQR
jgi:hypothetical protein